MENLNLEPSCDIFGYLMGIMGITNDKHSITIVGALYTLRNRGGKFDVYINDILNDILEWGILNEYVAHLTENPHEFITSQGEIVQVTKDMKEII
tara:strand:- start:775 stop:1059 length:285 start_codon:yes stop_codon:yes gene_type:complete